jgi:hypothetical protein
LSAPIVRSATGKPDGQGVGDAVPLRLAGELRVCLVGGGVSDMTIVVPVRAASMQGPNPASYCRSSSRAAAPLVKAAERACSPSSSVTDTAAAPGIAC